MKKIIVTFSRVYEINYEEAKQRAVKLWAKENPNDVEIEIEAEQIAREYLVTEIPEFLNNIEDFMSADIKY